MKKLNKVLFIFLLSILTLCPTISFGDETSNSYEGPGPNTLSEASQEYLNEQGDSLTEESEDAENSSQESQQQVEERIEQAMSAIMSDIYNE